MKKYIIIAALVAVASTPLFGLWSRNVQWVKERAPQAAEQMGYTIVGYEGYQLRPILGGMVWYTLRRAPEDNGIIYHAGFTKWGGEVHIYNLEAVDAIKPQ